LLRVLVPHDPLELQCGIREDTQRAVRFAQDRGFEEEMRAWESRLNPHSVDLTEWERYPGRLREMGMEIKTMRQLEADANRNRKIHALIHELEKDVPSVNPLTPLPFEEWAPGFFDSPNLDLDLQLFAVDGTHYVGYTSLWLDSTSDHLYTGLTGVHRDYRHKGVATALKVRAIEVARQRGCPCIRTWNEINNRGMLGINERLGFTKQPAWIEFVKTIKADSSDTPQG
jgi:GNAT superfamily N-acetyltransferase